MENILSLAFIVFIVGMGVTVLSLTVKMRSTFDRFVGYSLDNKSEGTSSLNAKEMTTLLDRIGQIRGEYREDLEGTSGFFERQYQASRADQERLLSHYHAELESLRDTQATLFAHLQAARSGGPALSRNIVEHEHGSVSPLKAADIMTDEREWEIEAGKDGLPVTPPLVDLAAAAYVPYTDGDVNQGDMADMAVSEHFARRDG